MGFKGLPSPAGGYFLRFGGGGGGGGPLRFEGDELLRFGGGGGGGGLYFALAGAFLVAATYSTKAGPYISVKEGPTDDGTV
jgi:hypothetical protein